MRWHALALRGVHPASLLSRLSYRLCPFKFLDGALAIGICYNFKYYNFKYSPSGFPPVSTGTCHPCTDSLKLRETMYPLVPRQAVNKSTVGRQQRLQLCLQLGRLHKLRACPINAIKSIRLPLYPTLDLMYTLFGPNKFQFASTQNRVPRQRGWEPSAIGSGRPTSHTRTSYNHLRNCVHVHKGTFTSIGTIPTSTVKVATRTSMFLHPDGCMMSQQPLRVLPKSKNRLNTPGVRNEFN